MIVRLNGSRWLVFCAIPVLGAALSLSGCREEPASPQPASASAASAISTSAPAPASESESSRELRVDRQAVVEAMNRGVALMGQYDYPSAVVAFEEAVKLEPELIDARINLAIALFNLGRKEDRDLDRSGELLAEVLLLEPDNLRALYFQGIILQHLGQAEEAIPRFEAVVARRPEDGAAWYLLGLCRQRAGQEAEADLLKAVEFRPYLFSAYYRLFQLLQARGDRETAMTYLERFKQLRESPLGESIELPQYNAMGDLALVQPLPAGRPPTPAQARYEPGPWQVLSEPLAPQPIADSSQSAHQNRGGIVSADLNGDRRPDLVVWPLLQGLLAQTDGAFQASPILPLPDATATSSLSSSALGDINHDGYLDLFAVGDEGNQLWFGNSNAGPWRAVTVSDPAFSATVPRSQALLLDADHDGDLDLLAAGQDGIEIWNNNTDGTFTNVAKPTEWQPTTRNAVAILPGDVDHDRDLDLIVLRRDAPALLLVNQLLGAYEVAVLGEDPVPGDRGGVLQDLDGDGLLDLVSLGGDPIRPKLYRGDGQGAFHEQAAFEPLAEAAATWGEPEEIRVTDLDLDGDLDLLLLAEAGHLLLNDGRGHFVLQPQACAWPAAERTHHREVADVNADMIPDLLTWEPGSGGGRLQVAFGQLSVPSSGLAVEVTGTRGRDGRTRSPATGYGVTLNVRAGLQEQMRLHTGLNGGSGQSPRPPVLGLNGAPQADYVRVHWTDGVMQVELGLTAGQTHTIAELERKISSCPVLFAWNGERMEFITDFAGVGGLGYFVAPGEYGMPQVLEHVKMEPGQLKARDGTLALSICEPMEETAYIDRVELRAIDHPADLQVYPDERAVAGGPAPTHDLLVIDQPWFPKSASGPVDPDCLEALLKRDRHYAYEPPLDRRFIGFCQEHTLELDFGSALDEVEPTERLSLFIAGFIEYPYSQTIYAASQAGVDWQAIQVDRLGPNGEWETLIPDGGWPGGMGRVFTLDLSGHEWSAATRLRLVTNLEIYYDQVFVGRHSGLASTQTHSVPLKTAELRRLGFPREYSPDGRMPLIYDYHWLDASAPFHVLRGAYTRYGPVEELLETFDDRYALVGPGDEIRLAFAADALPPLPEGHVRSYLLVSHAYCKDMDLYTGTPQTLEPLPFRGMTCYPYPPEETYPDGPEQQIFLRNYNTRTVQ